MIDCPLTTSPEAEAVKVKIGLGCSSTNLRALNVATPLVPVAVFETNEPTEAVTEMIDPVLDASK